jgi:hypothetical protein
VHVGSHSGSPKLASAEENREARSGHRTEKRIQTVLQAPATWLGRNSGTLDDELACDSGQRLPAWSEASTGLSTQPQLVTYGWQAAAIVLAPTGLLPARPALVEVHAVALGAALLRRKAEPACVADVHHAVSKWFLPKTFGFSGVRLTGSAAGA